MPQVLWKGNPTDTTGPELKAGDKAPDAFSVAGNDLSAVKGSDWAGKTRIVLTSPSLDTPVCDIEGRRFNDEAAKLPGVHIHFVTMDLPFAQKRWCGAAGIERVKTFSDWRERSFGPAYGVLSPAKQLLIRAVFVIDKNDVIKHVEYVKEVATEPNYAAALEAAKSIA
jgi:thioredoxin-dependent peroxiredoxin